MSAELRYVVSKRKDWRPGDRTLFSANTLAEVEVWIRNDVREYVARYFNKYYVYPVSVEGGLVFTPSVTVDVTTAEEEDVSTK